MRRADDAVYTVLAIIGVCITGALCAGTVLILGAILCGWMGVALGTVA